MSQALSAEQKNKMVKHVTYASALGSLFLSICTMIVGFLFHSSSIMADGLHSLSDLASDFVVLWATRFSKEAPDKEHPYGHGRFETAATVMVGLLLLAVAMVFLYENTLAIFNSESKIILHYSTYIVTFFGIVIKEALYHYQIRVGRLVDSPMVMANAWHSRSDALSSVVVLFGLICSSFGYLWMDNVVALIVALFIARIGYNFVKDAGSELLDTGASMQEVIEIKKQINTVPGVLSIHNLRSRLIGQKIYLDVNIGVNAAISVSEGHEIAAWVSKTLISNIYNVEDVTVHIDIADDEKNNLDKSQIQLGPLRPEIEKIFYEKTKGILDVKSVAKLELHYNQGKVFLELYLNSKTASHLSQDITTILKNEDWFLGLKIWESK